MCCEWLAECTGCKNYAKSQFGHHRIALVGCIFATNKYIDDRKNLLNSDTFFTCPHNVVNFGPLTADIGWQVWGTPNKFQWVSRIGFVTVPTPLNGGHATKLFTMSVRLLGWYTVYALGGGLLPPNAILSNAKFTLRASLALLHDTRAVGVSKALRRGMFTRQGCHPVLNWAVELCSYDRSA